MTIKWGAPLLLALALYGCGTGAAGTAQPAGQPETSSQQTKIGKSYPLKGSVSVVSRPEAYSAEEPVFTADAGGSYTVTAVQAPFVQISDAGRTGWIPAWYLAHNEEKVTALPPEKMLVKEPAAFFRFPAHDAPAGYVLEPGTVVRVTGAFGDWVQADITMYAEPMVGEKWIAKEHLTAYDPALAREGRLRRDAVRYDENGAPVNESHRDFPVRIIGERAEMYQIIAPGGISGYIKKSDFVPDPFEEPPNEN
ncbi:hypothetical protein G3578_17755 [Brevibacillus sp. SYP-B805]|uniref:hypothetical protein n=1 Tax=Brevibacillus sp. SYP-B805 TaxID=1578199 RepID=UPI0013ED53DC|nr:hypothetical protein [Brevibacillus sp. SYP-B805]NGQ97011.1 hypothetical protein [Brevibacillus sp. SYP-B805]